MNVHAAISPIVQGRKRRLVPNAGAIMPNRRRPEDLTQRELQILQLIWSGLQSKEIAKSLHISIKTVETHRSMMMKKMRTTNAAQLLSAAFERGLLSPPEEDRGIPAPR
jgi:DNA-binding NarL/FixJ family response regulator